MKDLQQALDVLRQGNAMALELSRAVIAGNEKLTATEFAILCSLSLGGELTVKQLEGEIGVSQSTVSIALKKLSSRSGDGLEWVLPAGAIPGDKRTRCYKLNSSRRREARRLMRFVAGKLVPSPVEEAEPKTIEVPQEEAAKWAHDSVVNRAEEPVSEQEVEFSGESQVNEEKLAESTGASGSTDSQQLSLF